MSRCSPRSRSSISALAYILPWTHLGLTKLPYWRPSPPPVFWQAPSLLYAHILIRSPTVSSSEPDWRHSMRNRLARLAAAGLFAAVTAVGIGTANAAAIEITWADLIPASAIIGDKVHELSGSVSH